LRSTHTSVFDI
jgi:hypothetical protein